MKRNTYIWASKMELPVRSFIHPYSQANYNYYTEKRQFARFEFQKPIHNLVVVSTRQRFGSRLRLSPARPEVHLDIVDKYLPDPRPETITFRSNSANNRFLWITVS